MRRHCVQHKARLNYLDGPINKYKLAQGKNMLMVLDSLLFVLHILVIIINLLGWISVKTRWLQFIVINITACSWLGLGYFFGWGYCFLTDWHWDIKKMRGEVIEHSDFFSYYLAKWLGDPGPLWLIQTMVGIIFALVFFISHVQFWLTRYRSRS